MLSSSGFLVQVIEWVGKTHPTLPQNSGLIWQFVNRRTSTRLLNWRQRGPDSISSTVFSSFHGYRAKQSTLQQGTNSSTGKDTSFSPYKHQTYANQLAACLYLEFLLDSNSRVKMRSCVSKAACSVTDQSDKRTAANLKANTKNGLGQADLKVILNW